MQFFKLSANRYGFGLTNYAKSSANDTQLCGLKCGIREFIEWVHKTLPRVKRHQIYTFLLITYYGMQDCFLGLILPNVDIKKSKKM